MRDERQFLRSRTFHIGLIVLLYRLGIFPSDRYCEETIVSRPRGHRAKCRELFIDSLRSPVKSISFRYDRRGHVLNGFSFLCTQDFHRVTVLATVTVIPRLRPRHEKHRRAERLRNANRNDHGKRVSDSIRPLLLVSSFYHGRTPSIAPISCSFAKSPEPIGR